jgi:hypothetical protein
MNMFNWFKSKNIPSTIISLDSFDHIRDRQSDLSYKHNTSVQINKLETRIKLLEDHLGLDYYHGDKNKPHYRTKRTRKEQ